MIDRKIEYIKMSEVEGKHWWYKCLRALVQKGIRDNYPDRNISIIDGGCGTGGTMRFLKESGYKNISGIDISDFAVEICHAQNLNVVRCDLRNIRKKYKKNSADVILCNDVLYFFTEEERRSIIEDMNEILKKNGIIILNLPAHRIFRGIHDRAVGIPDRFSADDVERFLNKKKYSIVKMVYWPFFLSPVILFSRTIQRVQLRFDKITKIESDVKLPNAALNAFFYYITMLEFRLFNFRTFGSSLFFVAKKL